ncbi:MAG: glycerophosphodiester phosphodiesterase family protein [Rikenellaceae bacterium]|nr:glycerophosphodiester phosphodiesterase family protein [Rikenellaceae bacterium]
MKRIVYILTILLLASCGRQEEFHNSASFILDKLHSPDRDYVFVASHRGDWRNFPENSAKAVQSVIDMGADIVEIDIMLTKDSVLVLSHDRTLDRATTGRGPVSDITYDSLSNLRLRLGHGHPSRYTIPTLEEILYLCKDRILVNIDKGFEHYDLVMEILAKTGTADQIIIKSNKPLEDVRAVTDRYPEKMLYMPIIDFRRKDAGEILEQFLAGDEVPVAYEVVWPVMMPEVRQAMHRIIESGSRVWTNSLWDDLCGGLEDDSALEDPEDVYGAHLELGSTMIQTDRPRFLLDYLRSKGRHN